MRLGALLLCVAAAACAGNDKKDSTLPKSAAGSGSVSVTDNAAPSAATGNGANAAAANPAAAAATTPDPSDPSATPVTMPNFDPDPAQAKSQVEQHLKVARASLSTQTPDPETALREARLALQIDAANVDAAAMVAFAYYHKHLYDTAELVLDDLFKRETAKQNANVYYVYGLVYDHTNRPEQAVLSFKKAVEINPNHASALVDLGVHQLQNTQYAEALQSFERLVNQFGRADVVTLTSLGSAYRGRAADYPAGSPDHDNNVRRAEAAYKRALQANAGYGPAYYNLGLLYLDNDPFPGLPDTLTRLNTSKSYFDQYKNMPGFDVKLYDDRMKDVNRAIKRAEKQQKQNKKKAKGGA
ncbi:MAG TPA: tetratricopeptide repeat protein [Kofleriaceae bacterium]|nr:tetratricopeptide repeat protein [Kofleriaceae bacterium]